MRSRGTSCLHKQRPYTRSTPRGPEAPIDTLVRALATEGFQPAIVSSELGIVHTCWENQGICYMPEGDEDSLLRRFTTTVALTVSSSSTVTVRADVQCCRNAQVSLDGGTVFRSCATLSAIDEAHWAEVDWLGAAVHAPELASAQASGYPPPPLAAGLLLEGAGEKRKPWNFCGSLRNSRAFNSRGDRI